jgi:hypothetical protein
MPGQVSNFMKNFGKALYSYAPVIKTFLSGGSAAYDIYNNLSKFDDPDATVRDKKQAAIKAAIAPVNLVPGVGGIISTVANGVVDGAGYIQDVLDGRKDPPPLPADVNSRTNNIGTIPSKIINSTPFLNFFRNF